MCKIFAGVLKSSVQVKLSDSWNLLKMNKLTLPAAHNKSSENRDVNCPPMAGPNPSEIFADKLKAEKQSFNFKFIQISLLPLGFQTVGRQIIFSDRLRIITSTEPSLFQYNAPMTTSIPPKPPTSAPIGELPEFGPRGEYECRLFELIEEGLNSGSPIVTTVEELIAELRHRVRR